ncbi:hypothetical protein [Parerythrobacter aestuarii]|uniref:hypothetical protein n=1 Tax=Parerythrobacter aestuarii TaxID=3020909 RepID=UPI0024DE6856|nr:hypothetical protein [Parerythrobacter aestuarii]
MIATAALLVILAGAAWLGIVGITCIVSPERAREGLAAMGSTWRIQLGEHIPRAIVGVAMVAHAPLSKASLPMEIAGWFIFASSVVILLLPMRWHHAYAVWWAERIPLAAYRIFAVPTLAIAVLLAYTTL